MSIIDENIIRPSSPLKAVDLYQYLDEAALKWPAEYNTHPEIGEFHLQQVSIMRSDGSLVPAEVLFIEGLDFVVREPRKLPMARGVRFRIYPDGEVVHEDDFAEREGPDYEEVVVPVEVVEYLSRGN